MIKEKIIYSQKSFASFQKWLPYLLFFVLSLTLTFIFFYSLKPFEFLYMGDQFFRFSEYETLVNSFFIRKNENLGLLNGWQFMVQFWDAIYYLFVYSFGMSLFFAERLLFFMVLLISFCASFIGFKKLSSL